MLQMTTMARPKNGIYWHDSVKFRTHPEVKATLSLIKGRLGLSRRLTFRGRKVTEEAIFAALVFWANAQDTRAMEDALEPHVRRAERITGWDCPGGDTAHGKPPEPGDRVGGITEETITRGPRRRPGTDRSGVDPNRGGKAI